MPITQPLPRHADRYLERQLFLVKPKPRRRAPFRTRVACFINRYVTTPLIMAAACVLLLGYIAFYELPAQWADEIDWRDLDRVMKFACNCGLVMVAFYLIACLVEAEQRGSFLFLNQ